VCRKFINSKNIKFVSGGKLELEPATAGEIGRYQQLRSRKGQLFANEVVLVVLNNFVVAAQGFMSELEASNGKVAELSKSNELALYHQIEEELERADNEMRDSFERNKRIVEGEIMRIVEGQLKVWEKSKEIPIYNSRLFVSAIIIKLIKDSSATLNEFLDQLEVVLEMFADTKKL
jgi:hypothetical protein